MLELDEWINSEEFSSITTTERDGLQALLKESKGSLRPGGKWRTAGIPPDEALKNISDASLLEEESATDSSLPSANGSILPGAPSGTVENKPTASQAHQPQAEEWMEEAERLFYRGRYSEAIRLFDRILQIEPKWERARQHRNESENYLRTGYIPPVALPSEAASAFGKAQSAARVGRYNDALALIGKAQAVLRDLGIQRWQEGLEFEQKLQENIDAENVYQEGL